MYRVLFRHQQPREAIDLKRREIDHSPPFPNPDQILFVWSSTLLGPPRILSGELLGRGTRRRYVASPSGGVEEGWWDDPITVQMKDQVNRHRSSARNVPHKVRLAIGQKVHPLIIIAMSTLSHMDRYGWSCPTFDTIILVPC